MFLQTELINKDLDREDWDEEQREQSNALMEEASVVMGVQSEDAKARGVAEGAGSERVEQEEAMVIDEPQVEAATGESYVIVAGRA